MAPHASRGIHAARPHDSLRTPFGPAFGCYFASLSFATISLGLLKGRSRCPTQSARFKARVGVRMIFPSPSRVTPLPLGEGLGVRVVAGQHLGWMTLF